MRFQVIEIGKLNVFDVAHFVDDANDGRGEFLGAVGAFDGDRYVGFHATHLLQKINMEISAAEFAIGDGFQAHIFLELDDFADGLVFDHTQLLGRDLALGFLLASLQQISRAQKAADMVEAGGYVWRGHEVS